MKQIRKLTVRTTRSIFVSFVLWFLNYIVAAIPFWCVRKFFYILAGMKIGKNSRIGLFTKVIAPKKINIGNGSIVNEYCHLDGRGGLSIGDNVSISIYTKIITASHFANSSDFKYYEKEVVIEDKVWVGCNAVILDGSNLKFGSIIGAGTVIKDTTEPLGIYVGSPAQKIKMRNPELKYRIEFHPFFR